MGNYSFTLKMLDVNTDEQLATGNYVIVDVNGDDFDGADLRTISDSDLITSFFGFVAKF